MGTLGNSSFPGRDIFAEKPPLLFEILHSPFPFPPSHQHRKGFEMDNGEETFASPTAAAAEFEFDFGQALTNGGGLTADAHPTKAAYDGDEMDALRAAKRDLEEKLAAVSHENSFLSAEAHRLEALVAQARKDIAQAEHAAAASEGEAAKLRAEVKRLQDFLVAAEKSDRDAGISDAPGAGGMLATAHQEKLALEEEIKALKASAAAAAAEKEEEEETAAPSTVAPKERAVVAAAAAGAAAAAAIAVVFLNLRR